MKRRILSKLPSAADLHECKHWVIAFVLLSVTSIEGARFILFTLHFP